MPRTRDLDPFIRRALPAPQRQMVGPFIFFDQFGPVEFVVEAGFGVRPHPHIGLATVTYLYSGEVHHRDSLGTSQIIAPGAVNWMVAGRGITHSERPPAELLGRRAAAYGIQTWVALPEREEDAAPSFEHHPKEALPVLEADGVSVRLILGRAYGAVAPAKVFSDTFYADVLLQPDARFPLPDDHEDRGLHILEGSISVAGQTFEAGQMMVFRPKDPISVAAGPLARGSSSSAAPRSTARAISGGISWRPARRRSRPPSRSGARPTGGAASSTYPPTIATNSFRFRTLSPASKVKLAGARRAGAQRRIGLRRHGEVSGR